MFSVRGIITRVSLLSLCGWLVMAAASLTAPTAMATGGMDSHQDRKALSVARQEIEYLRRHYARATDLIGLNTEEGIAEGRAIYRRIFTPDASITATLDGEVVLASNGPDEWVNVVSEAIGSRFDITQHLIGTQLVEVENLPAANDGDGEASMTSYLQAWHENAEVVDIVLGTYHDSVRYSPEHGWRIYRMELEQITQNIRKQ